jgi:hypothetical protein
MPEVREDRRVAPEAGGDSHGSRLDDRARPASEAATAPAGQRVVFAAMPRRALKLLLAMCVLAAAGLLAGSVVGMGAGCLFLAPAVLLALPLLAGRYLGAERLSRIARARNPRRIKVTVSGRPRPWGSVPPRGGLLIAASLAVRPPPAIAAAR